MQHQTSLKNANSSTNVQPGGGAGFWRSPSAVTSITIFPASGNLITGSRAWLYGLL